MSKTLSLRNSGAETLQKKGLMPGQTIERDIERTPHTAPNTPTWSEIVEVTQLIDFSSREKLVAWLRQGLSDWYAAEIERSASAHILPKGATPRENNMGWMFYPLYLTCFEGSNPALVFESLLSDLLLDARSDLQKAFEAAAEVEKHDEDGILSNLARSYVRTFMP